MTMLVPLERAREWIRVDTTDGDAELTFLVRAASEAVLRYLKDGVGIASLLDSDGLLNENSDGEVEGVPEDIQLATMFVAAWYFRNRDGDAGKDQTLGYLPLPALNLLYPYRDPALA